MQGHVAYMAKGGILSPQLTQALVGCFLDEKVKGSIIVFLWLSSLILLR